MAVRVQSAPFDLTAELRGFGSGAGAIVTFVIASICLSIPLVTDPTIVNQLTSP